MKYGIEASFEPMVLYGFLFPVFHVGINIAKC